MDRKGVMNAPQIRVSIYQTKIRTNARNLATQFELTNYFF